MRSRALVALLGACLAGAAVLALVAARDERTLAFTPNARAIKPIATVRPGEEVCQRGLEAGASFDVVVLRLAAGSEPGPPLVATVRAAGGGRVLATGALAPGTRDNQDAAVRLDRTVPEGAAMDVCFLAAGKRGTQFYGGPSYESPGNAYVGRRVAYGDLALVFRRSEPRSALAQVPDIFERATRFRPDPVGAWTVWALLVAVAGGIPALLALALRTIGPVRFRRGERRRERGLADELQFWDTYLATGGGEWPGSYATRLDPDAPIADPLLVECLEALPGPAVRILDVGAGPLTSVGKSFPGRSVELVAVDPLADGYDELLDKHGVEPPVRTRVGAAEELDRILEPGSFDIAHARNCLDHSVDPVRAVAQMYAVVRPGGFVVLRHFENEGAEGGYGGLHQWNFTVRDERLLVWGPRAPEADLLAGLDGAETRCGRGGPEAGLDTAAIWALARKPA